MELGNVLEFLVDQKTLGAGKVWCFVGQDEGSFEAVVSLRNFKAKVYLRVFH